MATGTSEPTPEQPEETTPPPPTPAPARLEAAEQKILAVGRRLDRQSKAMVHDDGSNGWSEQPPERLEKIQAALWELWRERRADRVRRKDLALVRTAVAPDEARRFRRQTQAYLDSLDDSQYLMGLGRWLGEWRDWVPQRTEAPRTMAEAMVMKQRQRKEA
jgi:hypothetical protein